ncbi:MAG TPA: bifunctional demethylmenaquinone methyltransferase/2-methoxy-6-polyprenyl-1,4-benzoquinol methylase UbiE [Puia sp.]|nr:bifunctional demethylmenaquinone methyltransferase/2-methoxy-6-polyprenyl-1,4-benzoquinol methylase UbiE [Puia sp.]
MEEYRHDKVIPFKSSTNSKKQQVAEMFDKIAFRYDFLNHLLSAGIDVYWRRKAITELAAAGPRKVLDVATGTADMAVMMARSLKLEKVIGIDISASMLEIGRIKIAKLGLNDKIEVQTGDSEAINFVNDTFDAVTVAFGVRNFENLEKGLSEMRRVLKPKGKLVVLEFSRPSHPILCKLYNLYMRTAARRVGKWVAKNCEAYEYLHESVKTFPEGNNFADILLKTGFVNVYFKKLSLGICTIYCGSK